MKKDWKSFTNSLPYPLEFLYKDQLEQHYPAISAPLPAVFIEDQGDLTQVITAKKFDSMTDLADLKKAVNKATQ